MALRESVGFFIVVSAAVLTSAAHGARAEEAYLCGPDKLVYVKVADLEFKKKTDPCIAAYYGLSVEVQAPGAAAAGAKTAAKSDPSPNVVMKSSVGEDHAAPRAAKNTRQAALQPAHTAPGTDYRNVRVINAASSEDQWFYHAR